MSKRIVIFGGSQTAEGEALYEQARALGERLARAGFDVVSGGYGGAMEAVSAGAKSAGGRTFGVTLDCYGVSPNRWVDEEIRADDLWSRMAQFLETADAFVVLEGSTGTFAELANTLEATHKRLISGRPIILLGDFWRPAVETVFPCEATQGEADIHFAGTPEAIVRILKGRL